MTDQIKTEAPAPTCGWGDDGAATAAELFDKLRQVAVDADLLGPNVVETLDNIAAGLERRKFWQRIADDRVVELETERRGL